MINQDVTWVTFDTEQSRSLLEGQHVHFVPYVAPRDWKGALRSIPSIAKHARTVGSEVIVTTGSAVGVSAAIAGLLTGRRTVYIESLARFESLSLTGRIISKIPGVERYTQSPSLARGGFLYGGSILDKFEVHPISASVAPLRRVFVTLGTIRPYKFDRAVDMLSTLLSGHDVTWQIGSSTKEPEFGTIYRSMPKASIESHMRSADVVVCHAGVGSIISALSNGKTPLVIPRLARFDEHVDDHQLEIATELARLGLVVVPENSLATLSDFEAAAKNCVVTLG